MQPAIKASVTACVMCGAPLAAFRPLQDVLCQSRICAGKHAAIPSAFKCSQCTRPLAPAQRARGYCDNPPCRAAVFEAKRLRDAAAKEALLDELRRRRSRSAAAKGISREAQASYRVALLPYNDDRVSNIPARRRGLHEAHLRACLTEARQRLATEPQPPEADPPTVEPGAELSRTASAAADAEAQLLLAACAACRGACCRKAGNRAYITSDTMLRYLHRHPTADDDMVVAEYGRHIGARTMTHGCVYQGERGCTLAPDLRADICHSFLCTGLRMLLEPQAGATATDPARAYFVHGRSGALSGGRFLEVFGPEPEGD